MVVSVLVLAGVAGAAPLGVATVASTPSEAARLLAPLARYVAEHLQVKEIDGGRVFAAQSVYELADHLDAGDVDVYFGEPLAGVATAELSGLDLRLSCSKSAMHTVVFARKKIGIEGLEDLVGKVVAFDGPASTFGYLIPRLVLESKGASLVRWDGPGTVAAAGTVGYVFSGDDENTYFWVLRDRVAAGAVRSDRFAAFQSGNSEDIKVVYKSSPLPALVAGFRSSLASATAARLLAVLQGMHKDAEGREILRRFGGSTGCETLSSETRERFGNVRPFLRAEFGMD